MRLKIEQESRKSWLNCAHQRKIESEDIKKCVDTLVVIGVAFSNEDHVENILDRSYEEYDSFVTSILSRLDPYTIEEGECYVFLWSWAFNYDQYW